MKKQYSRVVCALFAGLLALCPLTGVSAAAEEAAAYRYELALRTTNDTGNNKVLDVYLIEQVEHPLLSGCLGIRFPGGILEAVSVAAAPENDGGYTPMNLGGADPLTGSDVQLKGLFPGGDGYFLFGWYRTLPADDVKTTEDETLSESERKVKILEVKLLGVPKDLALEDFSQPGFSQILAMHPGLGDFAEDGGITAGDTLWQAATAEQLALAPEVPGYYQGFYDQNLILSAGDLPYASGGLTVSLSAADPSEVLVNGAPAEEASFPVQVSKDGGGRVTEIWLAPTIQVPVGSNLPPDVTAAGIVGAVCSYDPKKPVTVSLYLKADGGYPDTATKQVVLPTWSRETDGEGRPFTGNGRGTGRYSQKVSFAADTSGVYKLVFSKNGHLSTTLLDVPIDAAAATLLPELFLLPGDLDGDGKTKLTDRTLLLGFLHHNSAAEIQEQRDAADINGDGTITMEDLNIMMHPAYYNQENTVQTYETPSARSGEGGVMRD